MDFNKWDIKFFFIFLFDCDKNVVLGEYLFILILRLFNNFFLNFLNEREVNCEGKISVILILLLVYVDKLDWMIFLIVFVFLNLFWLKLFR